MFQNWNLSSDVPASVRPVCEAGRLRVAIAAMKEHGSGSLHAGNDAAVERSKSGAAELRASREEGGASTRVEVLSGTVRATWVPGSKETATPPRASIGP